MSVGDVEADGLGRVDVDRDLRQNDDQIARTEHLELELVVDYPCLVSPRTSRTVIGPLTVSLYVRPSFLTQLLLDRTASLGQKRTSCHVNSKDRICSVAVIATARVSRYRRGCRLVSWSFGLVSVVVVVVVVIVVVVVNLAHLVVSLSLSLSLPL